MAKKGDETARLLHQAISQATRQLATLLKVPKNDRWYQVTYYIKLDENGVVIGMTTPGVYLHRKDP